jgi:hypothetical protein
MSYPPHGSARVGRLSDDTQQRFYASARIHTALAEQRVCRPQQYFHVIGIQVKRSSQIRVLVLGEYHHVYMTGYSRVFGTDPGNLMSRWLNELPHDKALSTIYIDAFLASILSDPRAGESDYVRGRALLAEIASEWPIDAVFYPSVKDAWGTNIVIAPEAVDGAMNFCISRIIRIEQRRQFGIVETTLVRQARGIADDGRFEWKDEAEAGREIVFGLTKEEHDFAQRNAASPSGLIELKDFRRTFG